MDRHSTPAFGRSDARTMFVRLGLAVALVNAAASTTTGQVLVTYSGSSANWNDAASWSGGTPTWTSGTTDLAFPTTASLAVSANAANTNNVSSGTIRNLTFLDGASGYTLSGSAMSLTGTIVNFASTGTNSILFPLTLRSSTTTFVSGTLGSTTAFGNLGGLTSGTLRLQNSGSGSASDNVTFIFGGTSSLPSTSAIWVQRPSSTGSPTMRINLSSTNALGNATLISRAAGPIIDNIAGAPVAIANVSSMGDVTFNGSNRLTTGTLRFFSDTASSAQTPSIYVNGTAPLAVSALASNTSALGTYSITTVAKSGTGTLEVTGASPNFTSNFAPVGGLTVLGDVNALGSGTIAQGTFSTSGTITASKDLTAGAGIPVTFSLGGDSNNSRSFYLGGTNSMKFSGPVRKVSGNTTGDAIYFVNSAGSVIEFSGTFAYGYATGTVPFLVTLRGSGNANISGPIVNASGSTGFSQSIVKTDSGVLILSGSNSYSGTTSLQGGLLRIDNANALPGGVGTTGGVNNLAISGGVLGLGEGNTDFQRPLGTGSTAVQITTGGGFAAFGSESTRNVNLGGGGAAVTWGAGNFMTTATGTLALGHATADGTVDFQNPIATGTGGGTTRTISVAQGPATVEGRLSGVVSGTHSLVIVGGGILSLTNTNSFTGQVQVNNGGVEVGWMAATGQNSPLGTSGTINLGSGATAGTFRWVGGDATLGRTLNLAGSTGGGTIDASGTGALTISSILGAAGAKVLTLAGSSTAANAVGVIPSASGLDVVKDGPGLWRLTAVSSFGGAFTLKNGTIVAAVNPAGSFGPFGSGQDPTLGDESPTSSGTATLLLAKDVTTDRVFKVPATSGSQAVVIGIGEPGGTANFTNQIRTSRDVTLVASGSSTVIFDQPWVSFDNTALTKNVTVGAAGYTGTVRINKDLVTSGLVAVPFGDLNLGLTGTIGSGGGPLLIGANGSLSGIGRVTGGIGGAGLVAPGNSPGIATVGSVDPSGGLDFNFEFTGTGSPTYDNAAASVNDVLRITGSTPFTSSLSGSNDNVVNVYLSAGSLVGGEVFRGGFYTDTAADFFSSVKDATFNYWVAGSGTHIYNSGTYVPLATYNSALTMSLSTVPQTTGTFGNGDPLTGQVTQFTVVVPEPGTLALAALGLGLVGYAIGRRRRAL